MSTAASLLLTALLSLFHGVPPYNMQRITITRQNIVQNAAESERQFGVPAGLMLSVAWMESRLGSDRASGGCWGAPTSPQRRQVAGTPLQAARAMARSFEVCRSWEGAVARFRSGLCRAPQHQRYINNVMSIARRTYIAAGQPMPAGLQARVTASR